MSIFQEFINAYGVQILWTIVTAIFGYLGIVAKKLCERFINDKTKKDVARTCVRAVEQIYTDLHGEEKLNKCIEAMSQMLAEKNIEITEIEIRMLIEAAVNEFNDAFGDNKEQNAGE